MIENTNGAKTTQETNGAKTTQETKKIKETKMIENTDGAKTTQETKKTKGTKMSKALLIAAIVLCAIFCFAACDLTGESFTLTFFDGTTFLTTQSVKDGTTVSNLDDIAPSKSGYMFKGWYTNDSLTDPVVYPLNVNKSMSIYAKYVEMSEITFKIGETTVKTVEIERSVNANIDVIAPTEQEIANAMPAGQKFVSWETPADTDKRFVTVTAKLEGVFSVQFFDGANEVDDKNQTYSTSDISQLDFSGLQSPGLVFDGWFANKELDGYKIENLDAGSSGNKTFYAKWSFESFSFALSTDASGNSISYGADITLMAGDITTNGTHATATNEIVYTYRWFAGNISEMPVDAEPLSTDKNFVVKKPSVLGANVYTLFVTATSDKVANDLIARKSISFSVTPLNLEINQDDLSVSVTYDGKAHTINTGAVAIADVTFEYSIDGENWGIEAPKFTNASENSIQFRVSKENYATFEGKATLTIAKAVPVTQELTKYFGTVGGSTDQIVLPEGFAFDATTQFDKVEKIILLATFTPLDTVNFEIVTGVKVVVEILEVIESISVESTKTEYIAFDTVDTNVLTVVITWKSGNTTKVNAFGEASPEDISYSISYLSENGKSFRAGDKSFIVKVGDLTSKVVEITVSKKEATISVAPQTVAFGQNLGAWQFSVTGFVGSDNLVSLGLNPTVTLKQTTGAEGTIDYVAGTTGVGTYSGTVNISGLNADNYIFVGGDTTLTVQKAQAVIVAENIEVDWTDSPYVYNSATINSNQTLSYKVNGVVKTANEMKFALGGVYTIEISAVGSSNNFIQATPLTVTLKIRAVSADRVNYTLEDALDTVTSGTITVFGNLVLTGVHTLATGVTLILPIENDTSIIIGAPTYIDGAESYVDNNAAFIEKTLTINKNTVLNVSGNIIIKGGLGTFGGPLEGHTSGKHSQIINNGTINLLNEAKLDIRGYIKGTGNINANAGSQIFAPFVVKDFRGGTNTTKVYGMNVCPFNVIEMPNIQCDYTIFSGATYTAYFNLYASYSHQISKSNIIAKNDALLNLSDGASVKKSFESGITKLTLVGNIKMGNLSIKIGGIFAVSMANVLFPISHLFDITIGDGETETSVEAGGKYKFLPGSSLTIAKNATLNLSGECIVYDSFEDVTFGGIKYPSDKAAAKFTVNGTLNITEKFDEHIKSTKVGKFGGHIRSTEAGAKVIVEASATLSLTSIEANSGVGTVFSITENARFDVGVPSESSTNTVREYSGESPLEKGKTYTFDGSTWL